MKTVELEFLRDLALRILLTLAVFILNAFVLWLVYNHASIEQRAFWMTLNGLIWGYASGQLIYIIWCLL